MTARIVVPFPRAVRWRQPTRRASRRMDRAAVATIAPLAQLAVEALLRDEFQDIQRQTLSDTRIENECE